jgi:GDP-L-fucose synthase
LEEYDDHVPINVGTGVDVSISDLAELISEVVGYSGKIKWDSSKPDGTPRKLLDVSKLNQLGWQSKIDLRSGLRKTYDWFVSQSI